MAADQLIIFVRNPVPGTVKPLIADAVGDEKAVQIYSALLAHTAEVARQFAESRGVTVTVYYGDFVNEEDEWNGFEKALQRGNDLGERPKNAFTERFNAGAKRVVLIGSGCMDLEPSHLQSAYHALMDGEVVIGPATDGRYYLLGMQKLFPFLFENKPWGKSTLLQETVQELNIEAVTFQQLDRLNDVNEWEDVLRYNL